MIYRETVEFVQGPLAKIEAGEYANRRSIYIDPVKGTHIIVPAGWTISGLSEENRDDTIIMYNIPKRKVLQFNWNIYSDVEYIKSCFSSVVYYDGHLISRYPIIRIGHKFMSIKLKTHLPLISYYEGKGWAEEFFFSNYERSKLCEGETLQSFLEWFKTHNADGIELCEEPSLNNLTFVFAEIVL